MEFPEVTYALSRAGRAEIGGDPEPVNNIEIYIGLKPTAEWTSASNRYELQALFEAKLEQHPGLLFNFSQPIATRVDELLSGVRAQLAIKLFGPDLKVLAEKGQQIEAAVRTVQGTRDVAMEQIAGEAQLVVQPDRQALSRYGLAVSDVMSVVRDGLGGAAAGQIINGNERYDIYVRLAKRFREDRDAIADLRLQAPSGAWVRLGDVADVSLSLARPRCAATTFSAVWSFSPMCRVVTWAVWLPIFRIPSRRSEPSPGYSVDIGGQFENQQRAQKRLTIVVPVSLGLIALLLCFQFGRSGTVNSGQRAACCIGGVFSLWVSGQYLSVPSSVGFITLFGVAVLNGVVMVESINQRIQDGLNVDTAVFEGAVSRLRPVLMTAITSALGLIPMLLSTGVGAEIQKPLASVIVGGLVTATFLTLFVLPVLFGRFSRAKVSDIQR